MKHKKGETLLMSSGEYSDYQIILLCKVVQDFDEIDVYEKYDGKKEGYNFDCDEFVNYLIKNKLIKEIDYVEWNCESYGRIEFSNNNNL